MLSSPLISVVMCTYNGSRYLDEQVESILNQDYTNIELIISDDQSTDDTWGKLQDWQSKSDVVRVFQNEVNLGYNKNFEKAIQLAKGNFIALSDQDDIFLPQKLSKLLAAFTGPNVIAAHGRSVRLENGFLNYNKAKLQYHFSGSDTRRLFFFNQLMGHDVMFRRELVPKVLPIPKGMSYDWWIAVVATCYGTIASVNEYLVHHRIHETNNFFSSTAASKKRELDLAETLQRFAGIDALSTESRKYLDEFMNLLNEHNKKNKENIDWRLFSFLYRNRKIIFGHKRRLLPWLSYVKNSMKYAKLNYNGKGMSI